jgi:nitrile hydratase subunit alpha
LFLVRLSLGNDALVDLGLERGPYKLVVVENTADVHNVVVCTLCSYYPRWLLGLPPDQHKSRNYRSRTVRDPRAVLREFGPDLRDDITVRVHDSIARHALSRPAGPSRGHGSLERRALVIDRDPRLHDRGGCS